MPADHPDDEHGSHAGHAHTIKKDAASKRLAIAFALIVSVLAVAERERGHELVSE